MGLANGSTDNSLVRSAGTGDVATCSLEMCLAEEPKAMPTDTARGLCPASGSGSRRLAEGFPQEGAATVWTWENRPRLSLALIVPVSQAGQRFLTHFLHYRLSREATGCSGRCDMTLSGDGAVSRPELDGCTSWITFSLKTTYCHSSAYEKWK